MINDEVVLLIGVLIGVLIKLLLLIVGVIGVAVEITIFCFL